MKELKKARKNKFVDVYCYSKKSGNYNNKLMLSLGLSQFITLSMPIINENYENKVTQLLRYILASLIFFEGIVFIDDNNKFKKAKVLLKQVEEMLKEKGYDVSFDDEYFILPKSNLEEVAICYDEFILDCAKNSIKFTDKDGQVTDITEDINKIIKIKK